MRYTEPVGAGNAYRTAYRQEVEQLVWARQQQSKKQSLADVARFRDGDGMRERLIRRLGWPLTDYAFSVPAVRRERVAEDDGITIYRMQIEVLPGFRFYGILFVREDGTPRPLVIAQHGGDGSPEVCSSLEPLGSSNYNDMTRRLLAQDVNVFAPQLLLWNVKKYFPDSESPDLQRNQWDNRLKQCGGSITALEIYCLRKSLDWLSVQPFTAPGEIGMAGLSYGGFYTLYTAAVEPRIRAALSCAFFNDRGIHCWNDWTFFSDEPCFDPEVAMLCYPRLLLIAVGEHDPLFQIQTARTEADRLRQLAQAAYGNTDWFVFHPFDGGHEFIRDDRLITQLIRRIREKEETT